MRASWSRIWCCGRSPSGSGASAGQRPTAAPSWAPLPPGIEGHFGPDLRRFVLAQSHQGQVTVPRLVALLEAIGIEVSKRQVVRLLIGRQGRFLGEAREVLRAGLAGAAWGHCQLKPSWYALRVGGERLGIWKR